MSDARQEISTLIEAAKGGATAESAAAATRLAALGLPALGPVVEALKQEPPYSEGLRNAVRRMNRPELVPALAELLKERGALLATIAAQALGRAGDERAAGPLLELFKDESSPPPARREAALGLGRLRASNAAADLREALAKLERGKKDRQSAALTRDTAVALAMLGAQEGAGAVLALAEHRSNEIREEAAAGLKHFVGRGLFPVLQKALRSKSTDLRQEALEAVFYLGLRESVEELIAYVERGDAGAPELIDAALRRLHDLSGEEFGWNVKPADVRGWWKQNEGRYEPNVCHRLGKPIDLSNFVKLLATDVEGERERLLEELRVITGEEFGLDPFKPVGEQSEVAERARKWLGEHASEYERGAVYKHGHRQSLEHIFDSPGDKKKASSKKASSKKKSSSKGRKKS